jgi:ribosomal protein S18 acetylase RimI-like enzyme
MKSFRIEVLEFTQKLSIYTHDQVLVAEVVVDAYNTHVFGKVMGNLLIHQGQFQINQETWNELFENAKSAGYQHLAVKIDTGQKLMIHQLQKNGFLLMDTLVTYMFDYSKKQLEPMEHQSIIRSAQPEDELELKHIAYHAFKIDRFHSDPSLDPKLADHYYEQWITNSMNGFADRVVVSELNNKAVGFTTCNFPKANDPQKIGTLVLSAVSDESRGKGVYTSMIHEGVRWLKDYANFVKVGTQIDNYPVQKTWMKMGFSLVSSQYVFHLPLIES